jgi:hypothetical protein
MTTENATTETTATTEVKRKRAPFVRKAQEVIAVITATDADGNEVDLNALTLSVKLSKDYKGALSLVRSNKSAAVIEGLQVPKADETL